MAWCSSMVTSITQAGVSSVWTTSTSGMRNGGFHQWVPMMRSRFSDLLAISVGLMTEVLVARMASGLAHLVELLEGVLLEGHVLGHALEHEVGVGGRLFHDPAWC